MDKIPLIYSSEPRRGDVEYDTIKKVTCPRNIIETELFLLIFREETQNFFSSINNSELSKEVETAVALVKSSNMESAMVVNMTHTNLNHGLQIINKLMLRTLTPSVPMLYEALVARCIYNVNKEKYSLSLKDIIYYKNVVDNSAEKERMFFLETIFCFCSYMSRNMQDAYESLMKLQGMSTPLIWESCFNNPEIRSFLVLLEKYKPEILDTANSVRFKVSPLELTPSKAKFYHINEEIHAQPGLYTNNFIQRGQVIFKEDFNCFQFSTPFVNCDFCGVHSEQLYICGVCSYKAYCSHECLAADKDDHSIECIAYHMPILPMLEATQLYRFFVRSMRLLANAMSVTSNPRNKCMTVAEVWDFIMKYVVAENSLDALIIELIKNKPNYNQLSEDQWQQTISTSFRLSVFLYKLTNLKDMCFSDFGLLKDDIIIMNAAIFMRLKANIFLKSARSDIYYKVDNYAINSAETEKPHLNKIGKDEQKKRINANVFGYYGINANTDFVDVFKKLNDAATDVVHVENKDENEETVNCFNPDRASPIAEFMNRLLNLSLSVDEIRSSEELLNNIHTKVDVEIVKEWNTSQRCNLVRKLAKYFHAYLSDYFFIIMRKNGMLRQQKTTICLKFKSLNHSCDGNVELRGLGNQVIGVAVYDIQSGSELTASHGVHHMVHRREEREAYFRNTGVVCKCAMCSRSVLLEITNARLGLFCSSCHHRNEINPFPGECMECHTKYVELKNSYEIFVSAIENKIKAEMFNRNEGSQRDLAILFGVYNSYITLHFGEFHTLRLKAILKYARFLAINGFFKNACDVIYTLRDPIQVGDLCIEVRYVLQFYLEVFLIIKIIFESYIESACYWLEPLYPNMLLSLASIVLEKRKQRWELCLDNEQAFALMEDDRTLCSKWRQITSAHLLMSPTLRSWLSKP